MSHGHGYATRTQQTILSHCKISHTMRLEMHDGYNEKYHKNASILNNRTPTTHKQTFYDLIPNITTPPDHAFELWQAMFKHLATRRLPRARAMKRNHPCMFQVTSNATSMDVSVATKSISQCIINQLTLHLQISDCLKKCFKSIWKTNITQITTIKIELL